MYPTLTEYSAEDFSTVPGLAESWEESEDQTYWTYKIRPGLKWSDGQPLRQARRGLHLQPGDQRRHRTDQLRRLHLDDHQGRRRGRHDTETVRQTALTDHATSRCTSFRAHLEEHRRQAGKSYKEQSRRTASRCRRRPPMLVEATQGSSLRFAANPNFYGGKAGGRRGCLPRLQEHRRHRRGAAQKGEIDYANDLSANVFNSLLKARRASPPSPASTPASTRSLSNMGAALTDGTPIGNGSKLVLDPQVRWPWPGRPTSGFWPTRCTGIRDARFDGHPAVVPRPAPQNPPTRSRSTTSRQPTRRWTQPGTRWATTGPGLAGR